MNTVSEQPEQLAWMKNIVQFAAVYHLVWGLFGLLWPEGLFLLTGMPLENGVMFWQGCCLFLFTFGWAYWIASRDLLTHWLLLAMGVFTKLAGFGGTLASVVMGKLSPIWLGLALVNDYLWMVLLTIVLWHVFYLKQPGGVSELADPEYDLWDDAVDQNGNTLGSLSEKRPILVIFLRHAGCVFCREALADVQKHRSEIEADSQIGFVHMGMENEETQQFFARYGLEDVPRFSDPDRQLYRAFELKLGRLLQLFGLPVWLRGAQAFFTGRHSVGTLKGNGFQMPGTFLLHQRKVVKTYRHQDAGDRPDYCELAKPDSEK